MQDPQLLFPNSCETALSIRLPPILALRLGVIHRIHPGALSRPEGSLRASTASTSLLLRDGSTATLSGAISTCKLPAKIHTDAAVVAPG